MIKNLKCLWICFGGFFYDVFYFHFIIRKNTKKVRGKLTLFFLKKRKVYHARQQREEMQTAMNRPQDPRTSPPPHPLAAKEFSLQPNQRSKRTRLTLFWLCLLTLKTLKLDNLNVQYKTDSFDFTWIQTQNLTLPLLVFIHVFCFFLVFFKTFSRQHKWNRKVHSYAIQLIDHLKTDYTCRNGHFGGNGFTKNNGEVRSRPVFLFCFFF